MSEREGTPDPAIVVGVIELVAPARGRDGRGQQVFAVMMADGTSVLLPDAESAEDLIRRERLVRVPPPDVLRLAAERGWRGPDFGRLIGRGPEEAGRTRAWQRVARLQALVGWRGKEAGRAFWGRVVAGNRDRPQFVEEVLDRLVLMKARWEERTSGWPAARPPDWLDELRLAAEAVSGLTPGTVERVFDLLERRTSPNES